MISSVLNELFEIELGDFEQKVRPASKANQVNLKILRGLERKLKSCIDKNISKFDYHRVLDGETRPFDPNHKMIHSVGERQYQKVGDRVNLQILEQSFQLEIFEHNFFIKHFFCCKIHTSLYFRDLLLRPDSFFNNLYGQFCRNNFKIQKSKIL